MNPQQNSTPAQDKEPVVQVPEVPAAPAAALPSTPSPALPTSPPTVANTPAPADPATQSTPTTPNVSAPATAADVDVIEKEWVDKADEVVAKTAGDPHAEEAGVEELQVDYLKKRYDHTVDKSQEG